VEIFLSPCAHIQYEHLHVCTYELGDRQGCAAYGKQFQVFQDKKVGKDCSTLYDLN